MMIIRQTIYILSIITREMGKLKTYSPTHCIMDNWEYMLNLTHTLDKIYLTGIYCYAQVNILTKDTPQLVCLYSYVFFEQFSNRTWIPNVEYFRTMLSKRVNLVSSPCYRWHWSVWYKTKFGSQILAANFGVFFMIFVKFSKICSMWV